MKYSNEISRTNGKPVAASGKGSERSQQQAADTIGFGMVQPSCINTLQRMIGNRAMQQLIQRTTNGNSDSNSTPMATGPNRWKKIVTWDEKAAAGKGAFVTSGPNYKPGLFDGDKNPLGYKAEHLKKDMATPIDEFRNFSLTKAWETDGSEQKVISKVKSVEDIDQLSMEEINSINPQSMVPYTILHDVLHQSWHEAKHELASSDSPQRIALMRKLWEYRQWHHNEVLNETKNTVNSVKNDAKGLDKWAAAGSTTLTSDIDVNLKGNHTEYAVQVYNQLFKKGIPSGHVWEVESGVAYDVNVYALDFMHAAFTFSKESKLADGGRITGKEGARKDQAKGGFTEEMIGRRDTGDQKIWSLVKMRLYMTKEQWGSYVSTTKPDYDTLNQVELRYSEYFNTLQKKMINEAGLPLNQADGLINEAVATEETGIKQIDKVAEILALKQKTKGVSLAEDTIAEQAKMGASNRIYEERLKEIKKVRLELEERIGRYNELLVAKETGGPSRVRSASAGQTELEILKGALEMELRHLRRLLSEAAMFSNEAYLTDAAVNHAVVGIQSGMDLKQTKTESMINVNENVADCLKEIARHGGGKGEEFLGEAAYKASKYFFRLADAAKNMGLSTVAGVNTLYDAGYEISIELKGRGGGNVELQSAEAIRKYFGGSVKTPDELVAKIVEIGTAVSVAFSASEGNKNELGKAMPSEKNARNAN
ncbi:hypothetical protein SAMN03159341_12517 [Paenibacillus sp. 1_12]|uniref:hypothetical protein n=1 Tax=Paenibacillus sp. 1_12 TaxID=1566278 RepID=UPI0008EEF3FD|nr:hypothetical protein [Paenibacillus sp. 1_12]SFM29899.1 hypothetical protein SAMN03159341_12517 [Paenibacillus sp. 1_12]